MLLGSLWWCFVLFKALCGLLRFSYYDKEVDGDGHHLLHVHSIVCKIAPGLGQFNLVDLLSYLSGSHLDFVVDEFESKFWPWNPVSPTAYIQRVAAIFLSLDRFAVENISKSQPRSSRKTTDRGKDPEAVEVPPASLSRRASARNSGAKRKVADPIKGEALSKRRNKANPSKGPKVARSSGSALTDLPGVGETLQATKEDHKEFIEYQKKFWDNHKSYFLFDSKIFEVSIN